MRWLIPIFVLAAALAVRAQEDMGAGNERPERKKTDKPERKRPEGEKNARRGRGNRKNSK